MGNPDEHYRAQAALCREMAANARSEEAAAEFLHIANLWLSMASPGTGGIEPRFQASPDNAQKASISHTR